MGRVSPKDVLLKPPREQILQNCVRFMCEKPHIQTCPLYECRSTTSFEPITSQDCSTHTLYCRSAHSSYVRPDELKKGGLAPIFRILGSRKKPFPRPRETAAGAAAKRAVLLPSCGRAARRAGHRRRPPAPRCRRSGSRLASPRRTGAAPGASAPVKTDT